MSAKIRSVAIRLALSAPLFIGTGVLAQQIELTRSAPAGLDSLLVDERSWDLHCKPLTTSVTITRQPSNGTVRIIPGASVIAATAPQSAGTGRCAGTSVTGTRIIYRSNLGFHGTDALAYRVTYGNGRSGSTTVTIHVHEPK